MARKRHTAEQVVNLLRQVEVGIANGKTTGQACKEALITEQTYNATPSGPANDDSVAVSHRLRTVTLRSLPRS